MTTITLVQAAAHDANGIHTMTALPMNVVLQNLAGGAVQFTCSNAQPTIQAATSVRITYNAGLPQPTHDVQVSSVHA